MLEVLDNFEEGADGVYLVGCPEGECHCLGGNIRTELFTTEITKTRS
ncbi:MAG: hydrogenase iron-sulfur subunit [Deltaproteobacteria bacterium]|nr:hydrogenase iron-sulfur subunit [Deltaproteobacteria bacterium]